jgi:phosphoesterase RecJ-like protein
MFENVISFIERHGSFILTTHDSPDADGLGAQMVLAAILKNNGKDCRIINSEPVPSYLQFIDNTSIVESWDEEKHSPFLKDCALLVVDTCEEFHIGSMRRAIKRVKETFTFDHHEVVPWSKLTGFSDSTAASTCELTVELACSMGISLEPHTATAAYAGIVCDSGFFAYPKTSIRTFKAAIKTLEWGADPNYIYRQLMESASHAAILLQKQALSNLKFHTDKKIAVLTLSKEDLEVTGADFEDAENIVNIPLKAKEVEVSLLIKEKPNGEIRCSLRSKGKVNVSKIAQEFGGGGHVTAAGFRCSLSMEETLKKLLSSVEERLGSC